MIVDEMVAAHSGPDWIYLDLVDVVAVTHMQTEREILATLTPRQREDLAKVLRKALLHLGDEA